MIFNNPGTAPPVQMTNVSQSPKRRDFSFHNILPAGIRVSRLRVIRSLLLTGSLLAAGGLFAQQTSDELADSLRESTAGTDLHEATASNEISPRFYFGIGAGASDLDPDTSAVEDVELADGLQSAFQIVVGADINKWFSVELHGADLGSAELSNGGELAYEQFGLSGIVYAGKNRGNANREGITLFGRAGVGTLSNDSEGDVEVSFEEEEGVHLLLGAGAEYALANGLAVRAEGISFDQDASYYQLGLIYRFGNAAKLGLPFLKLPGLAGLSGSSDNNDDVPEVAGKPSPDDGVVGVEDVVGAKDECEPSALSQPLDENGCPIFAGAIDGLTFVTASDVLTDEAKGILDDLAAQLLDYPNLRIRVAAHTDSIGAEQENMLLSRRRALAVSRHLVESGVSKFRLEAYAFGESQPIAPNDTREGRARNRRVELTAIP